MAPVTGLKIKTMELRKTINIKGIDFHVAFDYQPEEPATRCYEDYTGYPGCAAKISHIHIEFKEVDFTDFFADEMENIKELIWQSFEE